MTFSDYRPISLVGCINKVMSKVLVGRLKRVIGKVVSLEQSAFLSGRSITDGPLMLNEWMKRAKRKGMIFKIDLEKAYDSISWDFMESIMIQMNFPVKWCSWIMALVTSARASVLVNGSPTQEFPCFRWLRQGDPISPFLFVMAMEAMTGIMKKACLEGLYNGLACGNDGPILSHLIYADDMVFLGEWSGSNARNLRRLLRCFHLISGLKVNMRKCSLFGVGVGNQEVEELANILRCKKGSFPFSYLGLQVGANMSLARYWNTILDTFRNRLSIWKAKNLSIGGRVTLLKSVLNSLPTYYFSLYRAPESVLEALDKIRRVFFWGGSEEKAKLNWVKWQKVIAPVEYGGLGLGSLKDANLAMLAKWWWRFKEEPDGLWRRVIWAIHHTARDWNYILIKMSVAGLWKQIARAADEVKRAGVDLTKAIKGFWVQVQKLCFGSMFGFWTNRWQRRSRTCSR
ncbi:putative RNA-directed DNA polymerase [Helianthus annuus]|nr:putative RNA-directed DNA polymerase [Helianthus annuus]